LSKEKSVKFLNIPFLWYSILFNNIVDLHTCNHSKLSQTLANTALGSKVKVNKLIASDISSKLLEMGLYQGQEVEVLFKAPFGDPIAVNINGYVLSLRLNEASLVEVI
jgi:Fe2+ transport system protein FeoA